MREYPPNQPPQPSQPIYPPPGYYQPPTGPMPPQYSQPIYPPQPYQQPYQPPYNPYQQPWMPRPMNKHAQQAQMFGVLGILIGIICGIPAIILGLMALSEIQQTGEDGTRQANTGLLLGFVSIIVTVIFYYAVIAR